MGRKKADLDTPFRKGERVLTTKNLGAYPEGTQGKIKLSNGLGEWRRYWVIFPEGLVGQIDHNDLVRPNQKNDWTERQQALENQKIEALEKASVPAEKAQKTDSGIPEDLLERSRAAKKRLLG